MTTIVVTRHFSGFQNIEDSFRVGNHEHEGDAAMTEYALPAGYTVQDDRIYDPANYEVAIVAMGANVALVSRAGSCADTILRQAESSGDKLSA